MYKKILVAVNEFINSEIGARYALALTKACRSRLFLVFAVEEVIGRSAFRHAEEALVSALCGGRGNRDRGREQYRKGRPF
jgi:hypothetical protein